MWYELMYYGDKEKQILENRAMIEYLASFINPEAVRQIKESRENEIVRSDEEFEKDVRDLFGRKIDWNKKEYGDLPIRKSNNTNNTNKKPIKKGLSVEEIDSVLSKHLDDITYTPEK